MANCTACNKPASAHHKWTKADIVKSKGASYKAPKVVAGRKVLAPLSPSLVGKYAGHEFRPSKRAK